MGYERTNIPVNRYKFWEKSLEIKLSTPGVGKRPPQRVLLITGQIRVQLDVRYEVSRSTREPYCIERGPYARGLYSTSSKFPWRSKAFQCWTCRVQIPYTAA
jgi:hypothetical protein